MLILAADMGQMAALLSLASSEHHTIGRIERSVEEMHHNVTWLGIALITRENWMVRFVMEVVEG